MTAKELYRKRKARMFEDQQNGNPKTSEADRERARTYHATNATAISLRQRTRWTDDADYRKARVLYMTMRRAGLKRWWCEICNAYEDHPFHGPDPRKICRKCSYRYFECCGGTTDTVCIDETTKREANALRLLDEQFKK